MLTAKVTDSNNNSTSSAPIAISVINNSAPTVSVTVNPAAATAPATLIITATANDTDGSISKVELFNNSTLITTLTSAPFTYQWTDVPAGNYSITAKATDNLDASSQSSPVTVTVAAYTPKLYDIHTDHLGTPRMVTDASGNSVWEWTSTPFGESLPNQNPQNVAGKDFVMNLRFPGQVFDGETGLHYNYFRDYDPSIGRYVQSDPIGLMAGVNTFGYVDGTPILFRDPYGLCISKQWADGVAGAAGGAAGGFFGGGGIAGAVAGGIVGGVSSYYSSGGSTPGISAAGVGTGMGGAITSGIPSIVGGAIAGGAGNAMGSVAKGNLPNAAGGFIGGIIGGVVTGLMDKNKGFNFPSNVFSGVKGGIIGGLVQDVVNYALDGFVCPPPPEPNSPSSKKCE